MSYSRQFLGNQAYCVLEFTVIDFISFTANNERRTYQRSKALDFFISLQEIKPVVQKFSENEFQRSIMFPYLKLNKQLIDSFSVLKESGLIENELSLTYKGRI